eukprot:1194810-Prorocentrum_minimum.AAC.15
MRPLPSRSCSHGPAPTPFAPTCPLPTLVLPPALAGQPSEVHYAFQIPPDISSSRPGPPPPLAPMRPLPSRSCSHGPAPIPFAPTCPLPTLVLPSALAETLLRPCTLAY